MIYYLLNLSNTDDISIKSEMNYYELIAQVIHTLNKVSINNKLTVDITIITASSSYMTQAGNNYFINKGLESIINNKHSDNYTAYSLFNIVVNNHLYIVCPANF